MKQKDPWLVSLGINVKAARRAKKLTQEELAKKTGLHRSYIGGLERGERNISFLNLFKITQTLGVKISDVEVE